MIVIILRSCMQWTSCLKYGYFRCSIVCLNLGKDYLNVTIFKIAVLLLIKRWTFWYIERLPASSHTGIMHCQIVSSFLAHPVYTAHVVMCRAEHLSEDLMKYEVIMCTQNTFNSAWKCKRCTKMQDESEVKRVCEKSLWEQLQLVDC